jgi:hypothetical protein
VIIAAIVFAGAFVQTVAGFGLALVAMPLLAGVMDVRVATPLIAVLGFGSNLALLVRHRASLSVRSVWRLSLAAVIGIPPGVIALRKLDPGVVTAALGIVLVAYAIYALTTPRLPRLRHPGWAWGFGFTAGLLSGAYNTSGPPVVMYGSCRGWSPAAFRANLQGFFLLNGIVALPVHAVAGSFDAEVAAACLSGLPGLALGLLAGSLLDRRIDAERFRRMVLVLLLLLGLRLVAA